LAVRFRSKFALLQLVAALLWTGIGFLSFHKHPHDAIGQFYLFLGILQLFIASYMVASYFFAYWLIDNSGLTQHRLWNSRTIPWNEVTHIGPWGSGNKPSYNWIKVEYARTAPLSDRGRLLIQPADRDALVRALRTRAPQANVEFIPFEI
jgi:hypothetical protein